ncbi:MAG: AAA family ATPase [Polyangiaceae bacterium]
MRSNDMPQRVGIEALVGREREIAGVRALLVESAARNEARCAVITGSAGIGKSRLATEIGRVAAEMGTAVWWGRGDTSGRAAPFATLTDVIARLADIGPSDSLSARRSKLKARLAKRVDPDALWQTAVVLGEAMGVPFVTGAADDDDGDAQAAASVLLADLTMRAFEELLGAELGAGPIVLVLDDAHAADLPSMRLFDAALRNLAGRAFSVVAIGAATLVTTFPTLFVGHPDAAFELSELTEAHARALLGALASDRVHPADLEAAAATAGGNPFVLEQLARSLTPVSAAPIVPPTFGAPGTAVSASAISAAAGSASAISVAGLGSTPIPGVPRTVAGVAQARIEAASPATRWLLRAASVLGEVFARDDLAALVEGALAPQMIDPAIDEACARGLLERRAGPSHAEGAPASLRATGAHASVPSLGTTGAHASVPSPGASGADLAFRNAVVREVAYGMLSEEDRARAHRLAAHRLAAAERDPAVLAWHYEHGGAPDLAMDQYRIAALRALAANDFEAAIARGQRAEVCGAEGRTLGEIARILADAHLWRGETEAAQREGRRGVELLTPGTVSWFQARVAFAIASSRLGDMEALHAAASDIEAMLAAVPASQVEPALRVAQVTAMSRIAIALVHGGDLPAAEPLLGRMHALRMAGALHGLPFALGHAHRAHAIRAHTRDDLVAAFLAFDAARASFERAGALRDACVDQVNAGFMKTELGQNEDAEHLQTAGLAWAKRLNLPTVTANAQLNLCLLLTRRGAAFPAAAIGETALAQFEKQASARMITIANVYLARALLAGGAVAAAHKRAKRATDFGDDVLPYKPYAFAALSMSELAMGHPQEAVEAADTAMATLREYGAEEGAAFVRLAYVEALNAADRVADARDALFEADAALLARAAKIVDPAHREAFLRNIPEHARTIEWADSFGVGASSRARTLIAR